MKTIVLSDLKRFEIKEAAKPSPGKDEVLVRIRFVGICGSDVHYWNEGRIGSQIVKFPFIIGHECSGEVAELGEGVTGFNIGQRVAVEPAIPCGECEHCKGKRFNICPQVRFLGTPPIDGAFREYLVMPVKNVLALPENISLEEAVVLEPFTIGVYAQKLGGFKSGDTVIIAGAGPIGLSVLMAVKALGAKQIFVTDLMEDRLALAEKMGADLVYNAGKGGVADFIMEQTGTRGVDISFEAAGEQSAVSDAIASARVGGRCVVIGIPAQGEIKIDFDIVRRREMPLIHIRRQNESADTAIALAAENKVDLKQMITHKFKINEIDKAFEIVSQRQDGVVKALVEMG
ncbi:MAG: NAD(P)-dependent alcohol dehydrogenase [Candidatus Omnitrophica bacterium]|nr:NAD(P)-dependent alcohol dehydrogenase [Candidatus Omnitrophota bacterium]